MKALETWFRFLDRDGKPLAKDNKDFEGSSDA